MNLFWILWSFDALISIIVLYFFFIGLADGSVSAQNWKLWLYILLGLAVILGGSILLKNHDMLGWAKSLLALLAVPGFLYALFMLINILSNPRWN